MNHYIITLREQSIIFFESIGMSNLWAVFIQSPAWSRSTAT